MWRGIRHVFRPGFRAEQSVQDGHVALLAIAHNEGMAGPGSNTMKMEADQKIADEALATSQQLRTSPDTKRVAQEIGTLASKRRQLARARLGLDEIPLRPPPPQGGIVIFTT